MAQTHAKLSSRVDDPGYRVNGRNAGGKLHRRGKKARAKAREKALEGGYVSEAQVVKVVKTETALEARIVEALERAESMIVENRAVVAAQQMACLEAIRYVPFVSATEGVRARLVAAGTIS